MIRFCALLLILTATTNSKGSLHARAEAPTAVRPAQSHVEWVAETLKSMSTVKPGMTRNDLLKVFKTEGGLSTPQQRYVSRECPYFKVDVEFEADGRPAQGRNGTITLLGEDGSDIITKLSKPYLEFSVMD